MFRIGYLARRAAALAATLLAVATFNFFLFRIIPGDPVRAMARTGHMTADQLASLRAFYHLDDPLPTQFFAYLGNVFTGRFGMSLTYRRPVADLIGERMVNTLILLTAATILVVVVGIGLGVLAAARRGTRTDTSTVVTSLVFWSLPTFWTGLILVFVFGVFLQVFPISGMTTPGAALNTPLLDRALDIGGHLVLPTLTLALVDIGQFVLITRSSLIDVLTEDFILTAKAKGLTRRAVILRHALPNAMLPVVTTTALYVSLVVGGAIQVEAVFSWPGMGRLMYDAVLRRDYPVLEAAFFVFAAAVILANLVSDLLYQVLDPRVREA